MMMRTMRSCQPALDVCTMSIDQGCLFSKAGSRSSRRRRSREARDEVSGETGLKRTMRSCQSALDPF